MESASLHEALAPCGTLATVAPRTGPDGRAETFAAALERVAVQRVQRNERDPSFCGGGRECGRSGDGQVNAARFGRLRRGDDGSDIARRGVETEHDGVADDRALHISTILRVGLVRAARRRVLLLGRVLRRR